MRILIHSWREDTYVVVVQDDFTVLRTFLEGRVDRRAVILSSTSSNDSTSRALLSNIGVRTKDDGCRAQEANDQSSSDEHLRSREVDLNDSGSVARILGAGLRAIYEAEAGPSARRTGSSDDGVAGREEKRRSGANGPLSRFSSSCFILSLLLSQMDSHALGVMTT